MYFLAFLEIQQRFSNIWSAFYLCMKFNSSSNWNTNRDQILKKPHHQLRNGRCHSSVGSWTFEPPDAFKNVSRCFPHLLTHPVLFVLTADQSQDNENLTLSISETELQTCQDGPRTTTQVTTQNNNSAPSGQEYGVWISLVAQELPKRWVHFFPRM